MEYSSLLSSSSISESCAAEIGARAIWSPSMWRAEFDEVESAKEGRPRDDGLRGLEREDALESRRDGACDVLGNGDTLSAGLFPPPRLEAILVLALLVDPSRPVVLPRLMTDSR